MSNGLVSGAPVAEIENLVDQATVARDLGFIGDPYVNVLRLNLALDLRYGRAAVARSSSE